MPAGTIPATPSKAGDIPERFSDAGEIISLASQMIGADQKRAVWRSTVERLWSGEPVYPMEKLRQANQSWRARTNYRGLEGLISTENTLDYDLETQGEGIVDITLDFGTGQQTADWELIMECQFKWMLQQRWKGYTYHVPKRHYQKNLHGLGAHVWPDAHTGNWIPRTPVIGDILFPDNCPFNFDEEGDYFMLRDFLPSYVLYGKIKDKEAATKLGWDVDAVWEALTLINTGNRTTPYGALGAEQLAKMMSNGDLGYWASNQQGVWINSIFCREYETGQVSQYSIAEGLSLTKYLYKKRFKYDRWPVELFPYDVGNGTIHSVKGLGDRTKEFFEMENRVRNAMVDQVMISSYPSMIQRNQNVDPDKMKLTKIGGLNWLPYGAEPSILEYPDLARGPLALLDNLKKEMIDNNRGIAGSNQIEQQDRMSGKEYAMRAQDTNHLSTACEAMQKAHLDSFYDRIVRLCATPSASKAEWSVIAGEWRDRCVGQGVPIEAFANIAEVRSVVAYGKGSASARTNAYLQLFQSPVYASTSADRKIQIERGYVASLFGYQGVAQYCRSDADNDIPDSDDSFAVQENNALVQGGDALAAPRQNQIQHLQIHFPKIGEIVQGYQQGQVEMQPAYVAVTAFGKHIKQHLDFIAQDPTLADAYKEFFNQWQSLSRIADKLEADIQSASEAEPPQQQASDKLQIGLANVQVQGQVGMAKANSSAQLKMRQQAHREIMDRAQLQAAQERDNVKTGHEIQRSNIETAASIAQDTALTAADIQNKKKKATAAA